MMRTLVLLGLFACATPIFGENNLWVENLSYKFGINPLDSFKFCPLDITKAKEAGYFQVENPDKTSGFADLTLWLKEELCHLFGLFFDETGKVAGMQLNQPKDKMKAHFGIEEQGYKIFNYLGVDYAYTRTFWVSEGRHYYHNMTESLTCDNPFYPWFPLFDEHTFQLIGVGHMCLGESECNMEKPDRSAVEMIVPTAPKCLYDMVEDFGVYTLHTYFVNHPRFIRC